MNGKQMLNEQFAYLFKFIQIEPEPTDDYLDFTTIGEE